MTIHRENSIVRFRFDRSDWDIENGKAILKFLRCLRAAIPADYRNFDAGTHTWTVNAVDFDGVVGGLRKRYFKGVL